MYDCDFPNLKINIRNSFNDGMNFNLTLNSSQYIKYDYVTLRCIIMIEPDVFEIDGGSWRLGQIFLNSYYTIFDA